VTRAMDNDERKKANLRLALILLSVVVVFLLGFVGKMVLLGR
jgi:flagellar basal body-associated protein FliL